MIATIISVLDVDGFDSNAFRVRIFFLPQAHPYGFVSTAPLPYPVIFDNRSASRMLSACTLRWIDVILL